MYMQYLVMYILCNKIGVRTDGFFFYGIKFALMKCPFLYREIFNDLKKIIKNIYIIEYFTLFKMYLHTYSFGELWFTRAHTML